MEQTIHIKLPGHAYDIHIGAGLLAQAGALIKPLAPSRIFIVTDEHCAQYYVMPLIGALRSAQLDIAAPIVVPAGEATKSFSECENVARQLIRAGADRNGMIIALGGGVVGDLAGFVAATALRGIRFVQMPTTLLAQVDSSVGGKTGINLPEGKNLVGAFYHPSLVIIDTDVLQTLPRRELLAGYAEIVKYGLINDAEFYDWCENNGEKLLALDSDLLIYAIHRSCANKAKIVEQDPDERTGLRALLNLGHTFGHAYEALAGYSGALLHGEAVALGLIKAAQLSAQLGFCSGGIATRVAAHLGHVGMPTDPKFYGEFKADDVIAKMRGDKKSTGGKMNLILIKAIGEAFVEKSVDEAAIKSIL